MKNFKSTKINSLGFASKLIIEVPHQRPAFMYDTNLKMTDYVSESSNNRLRDNLRDNSHNFVCKTLGQLQDAYKSTIGHQAHNRQSLIKNWCTENLTEPQYLWFFEERKSNKN